MDSLKLAQGRFNLVGAWFGTCIVTFIFSLVFLIYISSEQQVYPSDHSYKLYQALPEGQAVVTDSVTHQDARAKIVENFFKENGSVLAAFSEHFVEVADRYQLDYRLLPAIAMQESTAARRVPEGSFNPFGFGIYGDKITRFNSWEEAIEKVGQKLRQEYLDKGLTTPYQIMTKYTPPSVDKGGPWAIGVSQFMDEQR